MTSKQEQSPAATAVPDSVQHYVGGEWRAPEGADGAAVENPATGELIAAVPLSDESTVDEAVRTTNDAFEDWRNTSPVECVQYLFDLQQELEERQEDIAQALTREHGKTLGEARGEIRRGIEKVEVAAGIPNMLREGSGNV